MSDHIYADDLKPGVRYIAQLEDCCIGGEVDLGEFKYTSGEGWLYFQNGSLYEWNQVYFKEEGL